MKYGTYEFRAGLGFGVALVWGVAGCHKNPSSVSANQTDQNPGDPADANFASANGAPAQVLGQSAQNEAQQQAEDYTPQQGAPDCAAAAPGTGYPQGI